MDYLIFNQNEFPMENGVREWEGYVCEGTNISILLVDVPPGGGPRLHRHPYTEVFVVHEGHALFTIGSNCVSARAGNILIVPKGVPHKFINSGEGRLRQTDIHSSGKVQTEWLEGPQQVAPDPPSSVIHRTRSESPQPQFATITEVAGRNNNRLCFDQLVG